MSINSRRTNFSFFFCVRGERAFCVALKNGGRIESPRENFRNSWWARGARKEKEWKIIKIQNARQRKIDFGNLFFFLFPLLSDYINRCCKNVIVLIITAGGHVFMPKCIYIYKKKHNVEFHSEKKEISISHIVSINRVNGAHFWTVLISCAINSIRV